MPPPFKMPPRLPTDGWVRVERSDEEHLQLSAEGSESQLTVSRYNAARLFGMLAIFLEIPLPKALGKSIKLTHPGKSTDLTYEFPEPKTLGERVAQALFVERAPARIGDFVKVVEEPDRCVHGTTPPSMCEHCGRAYR